jgi:hypothetical protein
MPRIKRKMPLAEFFNLEFMQSVVLTRTDAEKLMVGRECPRSDVRSEMDVMCYPVAKAGRKPLGAESRVCKLCEIEKEIGMFPRNKSRTTGYDYVCLECNKLKCKEKRKNVKNQESAD